MSDTSTPLRYPPVPLDPAEIAWHHGQRWEHPSITHGIDYTESGHAYWRADGPDRITALWEEYHALRRGR